MGTKFAVESVVRTYFGSGEVRMWYEYGGEPHHFKILSTNPSLTNEESAQFFRILEVVKRLSSWLETILITLTGESSVFLGMVIREFNREAHFMGPWDFVDQYITVNINEIFTESTREAHIMERQDAINTAQVAIMLDSTKDRTVIGHSGIEAYHGVVLVEQGREEHTIKEE